MSTQRPYDIVAMGSCYVDTNTTNFPFAPEGIPTEVELVGGSYEVAPGGSAVTATVHMTKLGLRTAFIGMIGGDPNGDTLRRLLQERDVQAELIARDDLLTNIGFNMTNPNGEHIMLVAGTANAALAPEDVMPKLIDVIPRAHVLYLGGCFKLKAFQHSFAEITKLAHKHQTAIAVDHNRIPAGTSEQMLEAVRQLVLSATYYFPSRDELYQLWDVSSIEEALMMLHQRAPKLTVVAKDGANGAYYIDGQTVAQVTSTKVNGNATGAGDSFNGGVLAALIAGQQLRDAIEHGCSVARAHIQGKPIPRLSSKT